MNLILATHNAHKTREFAQILGAEFSVSDLAGRALPPVEETGATFEENAMIKAETASRALPGLVVADDSGLCLPALQGEPGVHSARYAGENATDRENVAKVLGEMKAQAGLDRAAYFWCVLALARAGKIQAIFHGKVEGVLADAPRGENGFGYDPIFIPTGFDQTFAELGDETKNRLSHRARAIVQLRKYLL